MRARQADEYCCGECPFSSSLTRLLCHAAGGAMCRLKGSIQGGFRVVSRLRRDLRDAVLPLA